MSGVEGVALMGAGIWPFVGLLVPILVVMRMLRAVGDA